MYQFRENTDKIEDTIMTLHDNDFNIIDANDTAIKALKLPDFNGAKIKCYKYFHGNNFPPKKCPACKCILTKDQDVIEYFEPYLNKCIELRLSPRFDREDNYIGVMHSVKDITKKCITLEMSCE
jgi:hypothetical protein